MRKILHTAHFYMIIGVISGLYYRELTKHNDFTGDSQLGVVHTHLLALGMLFFLIVLALEKLFTLTASKLFGWFFWIYNVGLALTVTIMTIRGSQTVLGVKGPAILPHLAGGGHILLTIGLVLLFITLGKRIPAKSAAVKEA